jgi:monoamine oxidase
MSGGLAEASGVRRIGRRRRLGLAVIRETSLNTVQSLQGSGVVMAVSRRAFIEQLAVVGGMSLAMAGMEALGFGIASATELPPALTGKGKGVKVVVLGAGWAGVTAAYELTKAGYEVEVIEPRAVAGGRAQTARKGFSTTDLLGHTQVCDFDEGLYINTGPWRIPYNHRSTLYYAKEFSVPLEVFVNDNDAGYIYMEKGTGPLAGKPVRKGALANDMRGYAAEMMAKAVAKGGLELPLTVQDRDLFVAYLVSQGRLSPKSLEYGPNDARGWDVQHGAGVADPGPGKLSQPFALADILHSKTAMALEPPGAHEMQITMMQPVGGMDQIPRAFERHIGHLIRFNTVADKITQDASGVEVFYTAKDGTTGSIKADYCICTIPLSVLRGMDIAVSAPFKAAMAKVAYAPVNKIGLQMKTRFWEDKHFIYGGHCYNDIAGVGVISLPSTGFHGKKGVLLGYYGFGAEAARISARPPADRAAFAVAAGQKIFPEYADNYETSFSASWHLTRENLGGWAEWSDEGRATAYPVLCEPDGRIYLSGEHLSYLGGWQAGAIESAWQQIGKLHARVNAA